MLEELARRGGTETSSMHDPRSGRPPDAENSTVTGGHFGSLHTLARTRLVRVYQFKVNPAIEGVSSHEAPVSCPPWALRPKV